MNTTPHELIVRKLQEATIEAAHMVKEIQKLRHERDDCWLTLEAIIAQAETLERVLWPNVFSRKVGDLARTARCVLRLQKNAQSQENHTHEPRRRFFDR
jgi:hypothetical protein